MKMKEVIGIATKWNIAYKVGMSKAELIRAIQEKEGYTTCFQREEHCDEQECLWRIDCLTFKK